MAGAWALPCWTRPRGRRIAHRADERFLICSTFKLLLVAAVLKRSDEGREDMDRRIMFGKDALLDYAPVAKRHVGRSGMSVEQLCNATITWSDIPLQICCWRVSEDRRR